MLSIVGETGDGGRSIFVFETFQHAVGAPPPHDLGKLTTFFSLRGGWSPDSILINVHSQWLCIWLVGFLLKFVFIFCRGSKTVIFI